MVQVLAIPRFRWEKPWCDCFLQLQFLRPRNVFVLIITSRCCRDCGVDGPEQDHASRSGGQSEAFFGNAPTHLGWDGGTCLILIIHVAFTAENKMEWSHLFCCTSVISLLLVSATMKLRWIVLQLRIRYSLLSTTGAYSRCLCRSKNNWAATDPRMFTALLNFVRLYHY